MTNTKTNKTPAKAGKAKATMAKSAPKARKPSRLDQLQRLITREGGASIAEMVEATGWQQHSIRGVMAGALKKRGLTITSEKVDGVRRYHAVMPA